MPKTMEQIQTEWDALEKRGLERLAAYPEMITRATELADSRARRYRADVGDISGDAMSAAIADITKRAALDDIPTGEDERAVWLTTIVKRAVDRERDRARARWAPRRREIAPSDAPNTLENWAAPKLIRHAEQFTNGALTSAIQARAIIDGRAESPTVAPKRRMSVTRQGGSTFVYGTPRTAAPSAESDYYRGTFAAMARGFVNGSAELLAASDAYRGERRRVKRGDPKIPVGTVTRERYISWAAATRAVGASGDMRRRVQALAKRFSSVAPTLAAIPRAHVGMPIPFAVSAPVWLTRWAFRVPTFVFSPTVPTVLSATGPALERRAYFRPIPTGPGMFPAALYSAYVPTGWAGLSGDAARTIGTYRDESETVTYGAASYAVSASGECVPTWEARLDILAAANAASISDRGPGSAPAPYVAPSLTVCDSCHGASGDMSTYRHPVSCAAHRAEHDAATAAHRAILAATWAESVFRNSGPAPWAAYPATWGHGRAYVSAPERSS